MEKNHLFNNHLFRGLNIDIEAKQILDDRITGEIEDTLSPFVCVGLSSWELKKSQVKHYPNFPEGRYIDEEQAFVALSLYKADKNRLWTYQSLYDMSKLCLERIYYYRD